ncbi:hypothetical protein LCGC14_1975030 [marine sediment metagenome]|uniref:Major capsid protein n=1 Tax=marine sediment metagenome TaxID=412755 RepID=A0A0F9I7N3_9ZZZZ
MPSGSLTLLEANKDSSNKLKRGVIATLIQESPILEMIPFMGFDGNAIEIEVEVSLPTPEYRKVNTTYSRSFGGNTKRMFGVSILGGEVFVDNYILRVHSNKANAKAKQYRKFAKAMARTWDKGFFDGTGTADDFKGVNALIDEGLGQKIIQAAGGGALDFAKMDEAFDLHRSQAVPDAILINRVLRRKVTTIARTTHTGISLIDVGTDVFGRQVMTYNDTPMRIIGDDISGNALLDFDEDPGDASSDTASIYYVSFGEDENVYGLSGLGGSMEVSDFGETESAPGHLGRVEWYPGLAIDNPFSIVRHYGILNA